MNKEKTLVLVDGSSLAFRMFFALFTAGMRTADGTPSWAVFGFFKALFELLDKWHPEMMAVCFDLAAPTFRHIEYEDYKAHRAEMPDDLSVQWPIIKAGVELLGIPLYELEGYEADDVIGTVAKQAETKGLKVLILTGDQDAFQLLDGYIQVLMPSREGGLATFGREEVFNKLGIWPEQVADYKALCGDSSDNIPGVKGIGPKTAVPLLNQYKTVEGIYEHLDEIKSASVKQKLIIDKNSAFSSKKLVTICLDVPLKFDFDHCNLTMPKIDEVVEFFRKMELNSFLKGLPKILALFNNGVAPQVDESYLQPIKRQKKSIVNTQTPISVENESLSTVVGVKAATQLNLFVPMGSVSSALQPIMVTTEKQLEKLVQDILSCSVVAVDIQTTNANSLNTQVVGYGFAWGPNASLLPKSGLIFKSNDEKMQTAYVPVDSHEDERLSQAFIESQLRLIFENDAIGKIVHNAKFASNVLSLSNIALSPIVFDSMLASYICNADEKHGLKEQAERILGYQMIEIDALRGTGKKKVSIWELPAAEVAAYSAENAMISLELTKYYSRQLDDQQRFLLWEMELPLSVVLSKMEQTGIALDSAYLNEFSKELTIELARLEEEIHNLAGHPFNINSTQQLQKILFEELRLPVKTKTKSGFSTDASVLESLADEHEIISKILEYRQSSKLRSTYVDALPKLLSPKDGRIHGEFNQTVTSTGRLSSTNPNLQNIPIRSELGRRIRRAFIAGDDLNVLIAADYSQIELRLLAHMSGDELLIDAFNKNQDIHARTAMEIFDESLDKMTADMRRVGKTLNFALIYQQGAYSTAKDLGVSTKEAQGFIDKYFSRYPKVRAFLTGSIEEARKKGYAATIWGRKRHFKHLNDRNDVIRRAEERAACNAPLQGSSADLMKLAMIRLNKELSESGLKGKLVLQVHDELVLEVPKTEVEATKKVILSAMGLNQPFAVPLKVDIASGTNWIEAK